MVCDGCTGEYNTPVFGVGIVHRCRANEDFCVDGKDCPDYIGHCDCKICEQTVEGIDCECITNPNFHAVGA